MRKLLAVLLLAGAAYATTPRPASTIPIPAPGNKKITLRQYRGKVVILALISSHCADCIKSIAILNRAQKDFGSQGFQALAALGDQNAAYTVQTFIKEQKPLFPIGYVDPDELHKIGDIPPQRPPVAPIFLFIDRKGTVRFQYYGDEPFFKNEEEATRSIVQGLMKEPAPKGRK